VGERGVGQDFRSNTGGVGPMARGQVDANDDSWFWVGGAGLPGGGGESYEPAVGWGSGAEVGGTGFAGDGDTAEGGRAGDAEGG